MLKLNKKGFTLIELLVVIAIIAVLASIVLVSLNTARVKGRDARRLADIKSIQNALELYYDSTSGTYPTALTGLASTYIPAVPKDPNGTTYFNSGNYFYARSSSSNATSYHLAAVLEDASHSGYNTDADFDSLNLGYTDGFAAGDAADCNAGTAGTPKCYDVKN